MLSTGRNDTDYTDSTAAECQIDFNGPDIDTEHKTTLKLLKSPTLHYV